MISQLDGLVRALQKKQRDEGTLVTVHASGSFPARTLAERFASVHQTLLLSVNGGVPNGVADWNAYLDGGVLEPERQEGKQLAELSGNGDYRFPAWATGETARRLLEGIRYTGCPWKYIVCDAGMDHNEGTLVLGNAADWIYLEIPSTPWEQANAYHLLHTLCQRNETVSVGLACAADQDENVAHWLGKEFVARLGTTIRHRLLAGPAPVEEFLNWITAQNSEEET